MAFEDDEGAEKEAASGDGHEDDGVAIGGLSFGWGGGCVVLALRAALWPG